MAEPSESDMEKFREDLREKRKRKVRRQDQLFDPLTDREANVLAVVALTIAVIVLGVQLSKVGDSACGPDHEHRLSLYNSIHTGRGTFGPRARQINCLERYIEGLEALRLQGFLEAI